MTIRASILLGLAATVCILAYAESTRKPIESPRFMPTTEEVRQIMMDCERMNPGAKCVFGAVVVPNFGEKKNGNI